MSATSWLILTTSASLASLINAGPLMTLYSDADCSVTPFEQTIRWPDDADFAQVPTDCLSGEYTEEGNATSVGMKATECTDQHLGMALYPASVPVGPDGTFQVECIPDALVGAGVPDLTIGFLEFDLEEAHHLLSGKCAKARNTCCEGGNPGAYRPSPKSEYYKLDEPFPGEFPSCLSEPEPEVTCGDVKAAYKRSKCCGNPEFKFSMPDRRLKSTGNADGEDILRDVEDALQQAMSRGGKQAARRLAKSIGDVLP